MLAFRPLPRPVWTPPPVVADPHGDAFEVVAAVLQLGETVVFPGEQWGPTVRRKAFGDIQRLSEFRRVRPNAIFGIRLGDGGGGIIAVKHPGSRDAVFRRAELTSDLGDLPSTVTLQNGVCQWHLYRLKDGSPAPRGRVGLGDGIAVIGNGCSLPLPPHRIAWADGGAPNEATLASLPQAWADRISPSLKTSGVERTEPPAGQS